MVDTPTNTLPTTTMPPSVASDTPDSVPVKLALIADSPESRRFLWGRSLDT